MKYLKWFLLAVLAIAVLAAAGFVIWAELPLGPSSEALAALQSNSQVQVISGDRIVFRPVNAQPTTGLIFYPGAHVDNRSYAPVLRKIAAQGYLVVLLQVPFNLASFSTDAAAPVPAAYPEIKHWAVGGHSLGGVVAAIFAANHPGAMEGLALWGAYPPDDRLADSDIKVVSVYGSEDALATPKKIDESVDLLPGHTLYVQIDGGNHGQFGSYGPQPGDHPAMISPEAQWSQTAAATVKMLQSLGK